MFLFLMMATASGFTYGKYQLSATGLTVERVAELDRRADQAVANASQAMTDLGIELARLTGVVEVLRNQQQATTTRIDTLLTTRGQRPALGAQPGNEK